MGGGVGDLAGARRDLPAASHPGRSTDCSGDRDDPDRERNRLGDTGAGARTHFLANLVGPFIVAGAGTASSFIPISVAALVGVAERQSGLASGLLNTSTQIGGAIGTAIASSVAVSGTHALLHAGRGLPTALTGGFHQTFWVLGVIALIAPPTFLIVIRRARSTEGTPKTAIGEVTAALAATN